MKIPVSHFFSGNSVGMEMDVVYFANGNNIATREFERNGMHRPSRRPGHYAAIVM